jgi:hypothetical protein
MPFKSSRPTPKVGEVFEHSYKGTPYKMVVVETEEGIGYMVDQSIYSSPTAAAKAVVGKNQFVNGWKFWNMDRS